jgi:hypothetical protein
VTLANQLQRLLPKFIDEKLTTYIEPSKKGTPKGEPVGFSKTKYRASLNAFREKVLPRTEHLSTEAERLDVPYGVLRKWRSEPQFKELVAQHEKEFMQLLAVDQQRMLAALDMLKQARWELERSTHAMILQQKLEDQHTRLGAYPKNQKDAITKLVLLLHGTVQDELISDRPSQKKLKMYQQLALENAIEILSDREMAIKHRVDVVNLLRGVRKTIE